MKLRSICTVAELASFLDMMPDLMLSRSLGLMSRDAKNDLTRLAQIFEREKKNDWQLTDGKLVGLGMILAKYHQGTLLQRAGVQATLTAFLSFPREQWNHFELDLVHGRARWVGPIDECPSDLPDEGCFVLLHKDH